MASCNYQLANKVTAARNWQYQTKKMLLKYRFVSAVRSAALNGFFAKCPSVNKARLHGSTARGGRLAQCIVVKKLNYKTTDCVPNLGTERDLAGDRKTRFCMRSLLIFNILTK